MTNTQLQQATPPPVVVVVNDEDVEEDDDELDIGVEMAPDPTTESVSARTEHPAAGQADAVAGGQQQLMSTGSGKNLATDYPEKEVDATGDEDDDDLDIGTEAPPLVDTEAPAPAVVASVDPPVKDGGQQQPTAAATVAAPHQVTAVASSGKEAVVQTVAQQAQQQAHQAAAAALSGDEEDVEDYIDIGVDEVEETVTAPDVVAVISETVVDGATDNDDDDDLDIGSEAVTLAALEQAPALNGVAALANDAQPADAADANELLPTQRPARDGTADGAGAKRKRSPDQQRPDGGSRRRAEGDSGRPRTHSNKRSRSRSRDAPRSKGGDTRRGGGSGDRRGGGADLRPRRSPPVQVHGSPPPQGGKDNTKSGVVSIPIDPAEQGEHDYDEGVRRARAALTPEGARLFVTKFNRRARAQALRKLGRADRKVKQRDTQRWLLEAARRSQSKQLSLGADSARGGRNTAKDRAYDVAADSFRELIAGPARSQYRMLPLQLRRELMQKLAESDVLRHGSEEATRWLMAEIRAARLPAQQQAKAPAVQQQQRHRSPAPSYDPGAWPGQHGAPGGVARRGSAQSNGSGGLGQQQGGGWRSSMAGGYGAPHGLGSGGGGSPTFDQAQQQRGWAAQAPPPAELAGMASLPLPPGQFGLAAQESAASWQGIQQQSSYPIPSASLPMGNSGAGQSIALPPPPPRSSSSQLPPAVAAGPSAAASALLQADPAVLGSQLQQLLLSVAGAAPGGGAAAGAPAAAFAAALQPLAALAALQQQQQQQQQAFQPASLDMQQQMAAAAAAAAQLLGAQQSSSLIMGQQPSLPVPPASTSMALPVPPAAPPAPSGPSLTAGGGLMDAEVAGSVSDGGGAVGDLPLVPIRMQAGSCSARQLPGGEHAVRCDTVSCGSAAVAVATHAAGPDRGPNGPPQFAAALSSRCVSVADSWAVGAAAVADPFPSLHAVTSEAVQQVTAAGSAGAAALLLAALDGLRGVLHVSKVGDVGCVLLRPSPAGGLATLLEVKPANGKAADRAHCHLLCTPDFERAGALPPDQATTVDVTEAVLPGDVLVAATGGFFQAVPTRMNARGAAFRMTVQEHLAAPGGGTAEPSQLAEALVRLAMENRPSGGGGAGGAGGGDGGGGGGNGGRGKRGRRGNSGAGGAAWNGPPAVAVAYIIPA